MKLVTSQSLQQLIQQASSDKQNRIVGRALVAIFNRQTESERNSNVTDTNNNIGFASCDARQGSIAAKSFIKHGKLHDFQLERWLKPRADGSPMICKYHRQLNEIAVARQQGMNK